LSYFHFENKIMRIARPKISGGLRDSNDQLGLANSVLTSTGSEVLWAAMSNTPSESANIGLSSYRVSAEGAIGSLVVIQSYNSDGIAVNRQTVTIPTSNVTLSSVLAGYAQTWVAAKITSVSLSNFFIVESDGTVAPGSGSQKIVIGDYSLDPIVINPGEL
jgi:hypothetical protein